LTTLYVRVAAAGVVVCGWLDVGVGVGVPVGVGLGARVGVAEGVRVGVAVVNSATSVAVGTGPHAASSEMPRHTTRSKDLPGTFNVAPWLGALRDETLPRPFLGTLLRARCVRIVVRLEILSAPEPHIEIHPAWRKRIPVVHPVTRRT